MTKLVLINSILTLILCNFQALATQDAVAPIPDPNYSSERDIQNEKRRLEEEKERRSSSVIVTGTPGKGQSDFYCVTGFDTDENHAIMTESFKHFGCRKLGNSLNHVYSKYVYITYNYSSYIIEKIRDQELRVNLGKIFLPSKGRNMIFNIFVDTTTQEGKHLVGMNYWIYYLQNDSFPFWICNNYFQKENDIKDPERRRFCNSFKSNNFDEFMATHFKFNQTGDFLKVEYKNPLPLGTLGYSFYPTLNYIAVDLNKGGFISVFPGVYGIEYYHKPSGKTQTVYSITINN